jgi:ABC-type enterobactin transport system permease subunit
MSPKRNLHAYWVSTSLLAAGMMLAGVQELLHAPDLLEGARRLGYPDYVLTLLGTAKLVGAPLLLVQRFPRLKEWVYAGFAFDFGGAIFSHTASGDTLVQTLPAVSCAALLAVSYWFHRVRTSLPSSAVRS